MKALIVSSSLDASSRSERLAQRYGESLAAHGVSARILSLKGFLLPRFDNTAEILAHPAYQELYAATAEADGLVLAGPVYNWGSCAELKRFVEVVGTTPPDGSARGAFFDKVVTFVSAAGLPHSYMAFAPLAVSMMLDFKCVLNPYQVYVHNRHWVDEELIGEAADRLDRSAGVMAELLRCLEGRTYRSEWEI